MLLKDINLLKLAVGWLVFFTLICLTNSVLIIVYQLYDKGGGFAFFLPFIHHAIVFLGFATVSFTKGQTWKSEYICSNYPDIAQKIYPDYGQQNNSKKWIPKIFIGLLFVSFVGYTFYRPNHFKYAIVIWILISILLPIIFLIFGTIILAFYKFYRTLFEGKQVAEDFIEKRKSKAEEIQKQRELYKEQRSSLLSRSEAVAGMKAFLRGDFDDGNDEKLNKIKLSMKCLPRLMFLSFFLILFVWIFNFALLYVFYWRK